MDRPGRPRHKNDERRMVGIGVSSCALVRGRKFTTVITKSTDAGGSAYGPPVGNSDFEFFIWLVGSVYLAMESARSPHAINTYSSV